MSPSTRKLLVGYADTYERPEFIEGDPSWFMHQVAGADNQAVIAFIASCLSFGSRKAFMPRIRHLLTLAGGEPHRWVRQGLFRDAIPDNDDCFYRFYSNRSMLRFLAAFQTMLADYGSMREYLRQTVVPPVAGGKILTLDAIAALCRYFSAHGVTDLLPKDTRSCCKRVCMFFRWMVRDHSPVDLGLWSDFVDKSSLIIPLDTHVIQEATRLCLFTGKSTTMSAALRLTDKLREAFPDDPVCGDFALFGAGVDGK